MISRSIVRMRLSDTSNRVKTHHLLAVIRRDSRTFIPVDDAWENAEGELGVNEARQHKGMSSVKEIGEYQNSIREINFDVVIDLRGDN